MEEKVLEGLFKPDQFRKAIRALELDADSLAGLLGVQPEDVINWEKGRDSPTFEQLENLARITGLKTEYFFLETPPIPAGVYFRSAGQRQRAVLSQGTRKTVVRFYELCRYQDELENLLGRKQEQAVPQTTNTKQPEDLAQYLRSKLGLGIGPIQNVEDVLFKQHIKVFHLDVPGQEFSGLSVWDAHLGPAILVKSDDPYYRRRFTLCHEYIHLVIASGPSNGPTVCDLDWDKQDENFANQAAAAFLIPQHNSKLWEFPEQFPSPEPEDLDSLVRYFRVSREAVARRLVELGMASTTLIGKVLAMPQEPKAATHARRVPGWRRRLGKRYLDLASTAYKKGLISLSRLAEYLDVDPETALEFVEKTR